MSETSGACAEHGWSSEPVLPSPPRKPRVLFFGEAVTLAHVARTFALMQALDPAHYEACLACDPRYDRLLTATPHARRPIFSIPCERFVAALDKGAPVFDKATLRQYVREDLQVIDEFRPDLIVGDFRLSLAVSAEVAKVPFFNVSNAYWSPACRTATPMPELPITRLLGVALARPGFRLCTPFVMALHTIPMNSVRREFGLRSLGTNLRRVYTHADELLLADVPELYPNCAAAPGRTWLGPVLWSPAVPLPEWWDDLPSGRPIVYVTLGSSGRSDVAQAALRALATMDVTVICATLGRIDRSQLPPNVFAADFIPGDQAAARSRLVISNGGSPTTQQALAAGVPVLGIASNMDQHLNMQALVDFGAGLLVRSEYADETHIRQAVERLLTDPHFSSRAGELKTLFARYDAPSRFRECVARVCSPSGPSRT